MHGGYEGHERHGGYEGHEWHGGYGDMRCMGDMGDMEGMGLIKEANCKMAKAPLLIQQNSEVTLFFLPSFLIRTLYSLCSQTLRTSIM
jgi:hypothetical protein